MIIFFQDNGAMYTGSHALTNYTLLNIYVQDGDDQNPAFTHESYRLVIDEEVRCTIDTRTVK